MASASGIRAGRAFVEIGVDVTKLGQGLNMAKARLKDFGEGLKTVGKGVMTGGAAAVGALAGAALLFSKIGDDIAKMGERTGTTTEFLSTMKFATDQSGSSLEDLEKGIRTMNKALVEGANGSESYQEAFAALGLSVDDLLAMNVEDRFYAVADAISKVADPGERSALAMELMGRSGAKLIPLMKDGAAGMKALQQEAKTLGLEMSGQTAKDAEELNDAIGRVKSQLTAAAYSVGAALAPALVELSKQITPILARLIEWVQANAGLIVSGAKIALVVTAVGAVLFGLGQAVLYAVTVGTALASVWTFLAGVISATGAIIAGIGAPILITVGIIAAAAVAFIVWRQEITAFVTEVIQGMQLTEGVIGDVTTSVVGYFANLFGFLAAGWSQLVTDTQAAMGGIADALKAGDLMLAAQILWTFIKLEWTRGVAFVSDIMAVVKASVFTAFNQIQFYGASAIEAMATAISVIWLNMTGGLMTAFMEFATPFIQTWYRIQGEVEKVIIKLMGLWDKSFDPKEVSASIEADTKAKIDGAEKEQAARRQSFVDQEDALKKMNAERRAELIQEKNARQEIIDADLNATLNSNDEKVRKLANELEDLSEQANRNANDLATITPLEQQRITVTDNLRKPKIDIEELTRSAAGTFSGFGAGLLGFQGTADQNTELKKIQQEQLNMLKKIEKNTKDQTDGSFDP